jgi:hypothetical protein
LAGNGTKEASMADLLHERAVVHVRFDGRSHDVLIENLDIGAGADDASIKRALARYLEVPEDKLRDYVVDRHQTGNLTVRPEAVFG